METTENEYHKFELKCAQEQPVQFHEQWCYVLVLPFGADQPSSGVQNRLKSRRQPTTQTSQCCIVIVKTCQDKRLHKRQQHRSSDRAFDTADLIESCKAARHSFREMSCHGDVRVQVDPQVTDRWRCC